MSSAVGQIVNFLGSLQNEWGWRAGVLVVRHLHGAVHPQRRHEHEAVKQCIQELIYNLNVPSRWGTQTPFTNLTFDWTCPEDLREQVPVSAARKCPSPTASCRSRWHDQPRLHRGDDHWRRQGPGVHLPIPTYNMTPDFPWESENAERLFAMTARYGLPYFQNFINSEMKPNHIRSMCCACSSTCANS